MRELTQLEIAWTIYDNTPDANPEAQTEALRAVAREAMEERLRSEARALVATPTVRGYAFLLRSWRGLGLSWPEAIHRSGVDPEMGEALRHSQHPTAQRLLDARLQARQ